MATKRKWDNKGQYAKKRIKLYEQIFGKGYISAGGHKTTEQMFALPQNIKQGVRVLDIGSGVGGAAFFLDSQFNCIITSVDLCEDMFKIAKKRAAKRGSNVKFLLGDILDMEFSPKSFDLIMSRDTLLHLSETKKRKLFTCCFEWLDDDGEIIIGDYCRCPKNEDVCKSFEAYIADREYDLHEPIAYGQLLEDAGFKEVEAKDVSSDFLDMLEMELERFRKEHNLDPKLITKADCENFEKSWLVKIEWVRSGDMRKGILYGRKR